MTTVSKPSSFSIRSISSTGHGRGAGDREPQRLHALAVEVGVVEEGLVDRGRPGQRGDGVLGDVRHGHRDVEHRLRDEGGADREAGDDAGLVPEGVEERVDDEVAVVAAEADDGRPVGEAAQRLAVGGDHALRVPRGARREEDVGRVVARRARPPARRPSAWLDRRRRRRGTSAHGVGAGGGVAAEHDGVLEVRQVVALEHGDVVVAEEAVDRHEDAGPGSWRGCTPPRPPCSGC